MRASCKVQFNIIIPVYVNECPYYTFTSEGVHTHPPPPLSRTPEALSKEIVSLIHRINDPSMTVGMKVSQTRCGHVTNMLASFLKSPFLRELCKNYNKPSFTQVHQSLV